MCVMCMRTWMWLNKLIDLNLNWTFLLLFVAFKMIENTQWHNLSTALKSSEIIHYDFIYKLIITYMFVFSSFLLHHQNYLGKYYISCQFIYIWYLFALKRKSWYQSYCIECFCFPFFSRSLSIFNFSIYPSIDLSISLSICVKCICVATV